jgi:hypothetical protein
LSIDSRQRILEWTIECTCNSGKPSFDAIEFSTNNSKMKLVCGNCRGVICWWPINAEQIATLESKTKEKLLTVPKNLTQII